MLRSHFWHRECSALVRAGKSVPRPVARRVLLCVVECTLASAPTLSSVKVGLFSFFQNNVYVLSFKHVSTLC